MDILSVLTIPSALISYLDKDDILNLRLVNYSINQILSNEFKRYKIRAIFLKTLTNKYTLYINLNYLYNNDNIFLPKLINISEIMFGPFHTFNIGLDKQQISDIKYPNTYKSYACTKISDRVTISKLAKLLYDNRVLTISIDQTWMPNATHGIIVAIQCKEEIIILNNSIPDFELKINNFNYYDVLKGEFNKNKEYYSTEKISTD